MMAASVFDLRILLPTVDNLRNLLVMPTAKMLSFLQQDRQVL